jgi:hypothetical protein
MAMMAMKKSDYGETLAQIISSGNDRKKYFKQPYYIAFRHFSREDLMERAGMEATKEDIVSFFSDSFGIVPTIRKNTIKRFEYLEVLSELLKS